MVLANFTTCSVVSVACRVFDYDGINRVQGSFFRGKRGVAQLVERRSPKPQVAGSIPVAPAIL